MQTSQKHQTSSGMHGFYHQPRQQIDPYGLSHFQIGNGNVLSDSGSQGTSISFETFKEEYFTLDSSTATTSIVYDSPAPSISSNRSPFSPQGSHSCLSDHHYSPDNLYGSPASSLSSADDSYILKQKMRELEVFLMEPDSDARRSDNFCFLSEVHQANPGACWDWSKMMEMIPRLNLKDVLIACAEAVSDKDINRAAGLMHVLDRMVSVTGDPMERVGAYMLEGLRARLELSGSIIYRALKCDVPVSSDLMTYMGILYQICPYWKFAYLSANAAIQEAVAHERVIHIIDFQITQGTQWIQLIKALANQQGGPPVIHMTGVDDSQSFHARGRGLHVVGQRLLDVARKCNVPFEFHDTAMTCCEVRREDLKILPGEAVVVNFPYVLHHMPDESVNTTNHRDQLLRLVKSLRPSIVTLTEQESNTNTKPFYPRFIETLDYYTAMFESIDVARPRDDKQRINAEQHCVARDIVNIIACENDERVERHELLGKWRVRFSMAGFTQCPLSSSVSNAIRDLLKEYDENYRHEERDGALYLLWKRMALATSSAWR